MRAWYPCFIFVFLLLAFLATILAVQRLSSNDIDEGYAALFF